MGIWGESLRILALTSPLVAPGLVRRSVCVEVYMMEQPRGLLWEFGAKVFGFWP